jgi:glycosyltransferase involved in cell wall biosynthesis
VRILLANAYGADRFYGGAERYVRELRDGLSRRGHTIAVLAAFPARADDSEVLRTLHSTDWQSSTVRRALNHADDWLGTLPRGADAVLAELAPDLIHTNTLPGMSTGIWELARRRGIPVVHTIHDYHLLCPRVSLTRRDGSPCHPHPLLCGARSRRLAHWRAGVGALIGVSRHVLERHHGFFDAGVPQTVVRPPRTSVPGAEQATPPQRMTQLGYLGTLNADKGVAMLLTAAPELAQRGIGLRIAGGGPLEDEVRAAAGVEYAGRLQGDDVGRFLASCDVGVVASQWEDPAPFTPLEWLAAGRPVLATTNGGLPELAELGGVRTFDGSASGLLQAVAALSVPADFTELLTTVPATDGATDLERWLDEHLDVYGQAAAQAAPDPPGATLAGPGDVSRAGAGKSGAADARTKGQDSGDAFR